MWNPKSSVSGILHQFLDLHRTLNRRSVLCSTEAYARYVELFLESAASIFLQESNAGMQMQREVVDSSYVPSFLSRGHLPRNGLKAVYIYE
jgi:hypothetical protein